MVHESDLHILADWQMQEEARHLLIQYRNQIEGYIARNPGFNGALLPLAEDITASPIVKDMLQAGRAAGVGPMAAVAGALAEQVGRGLLAAGSKEVMVENGGDIFLKRSIDCRVAIFAGSSPLSEKIGIRVAAADMPIGICTSSGTVGHSLSFGEADAVTVLAASVSLADTAATRLANETKGDIAINDVLEVAATIRGVLGVVVVRGEEFGAWGSVELVEL